MNVDIENLQKLIDNAKKARNQVKDKTSQIISEIDAYIENDNYSSKAFDENKNKMNNLIKPLLKAFEYLFDIYVNDLVKVRSTYLREVDNISLDTDVLSDCISKVTQRKDNEYEKYLLACKLSTDTARSYGFEPKFRESYESCCDLETRLIQTTAKLLDFESNDFLLNTKNQINKINTLMKRIECVDAFVATQRVLKEALQIKISFSRPLPKLEDYDTYDDYLEAVGLYAAETGKAKEIEINGITYYEFIGTFQLSNYENSTPCKLYISVNGDTVSTFLESESGVRISVPNGILVAKNKNERYCVDDSGNYVDFFESMLTDQYDNNEMVIDVLADNSERINKVSRKDRKKIRKYGEYMADKNIAHNTAISILTKKARDEGHTDYSLEVLNSVAAPYMQDQIPEEDRVEFMAGEIELHAEGVCGDSWDAKLGEAGYRLKDFIDKEDTNILEYNEAMSVGDLDGNEKGTNLSKTTKFVVMFYLDKHKKLVKEKYD